jgi:hypothetical protein
MNFCLHMRSRHAIHTQITTARCVTLFVTKHQKSAFKFMYRQIHKERFRTLMTHENMSTCFGFHNSGFRCASVSCVLRATFESDCTVETESAIEEAQQPETKRSLFDFSTSPRVCIITLLDTRRDCKL